MKSKKILAMIVAFVAFMAVATSGLAATTTYNYITDGYVDVEVEAIAEAGSEVTYLVETESGVNKTIVYIDQQTADGTSGAVEFNYKILASKLKDVTTTVKFGTDGATAPTGIEQLAFAPANVTGNNITVTYWKDADCEVNEIGSDATLGTGDTVYAKVVAAADYKLVSYTKNAVTTTEEAAYYAIPVAYGDVVTVATEEVVQTPEITEIDVDDEETVDGSIEKTKVMKVIGNYVEAGVTFDGQNYPAMADENSKYTGAEYFAVKLIVPAEYASVQPEAYVVPVNN